MQLFVAIFGPGTVKNNMLDLVVLNKLKEKYSHVHPLIFHRSVEHSKTNGELFDILDTIPKGWPLVWNEKKNKWSLENDLFLLRDFEGEI